MASIHILGLGNMGKYVAYAIMRQRQPAAAARTPPATLLFHRPGLLADWKSAGLCIRYTSMTSQGPVEGPRVEGFSIDLLDSAVTTRIRYLIVATKAHATAAALAPLKHRLDGGSHILFLQNGMGVENELNKTVFTDIRTRPTYWTGICSAGVYSESPFSIIHAGRGPLLFGLAQPPTTTLPSPTENFMAAQLLGADILEADLLPPGELMQARLKKLVVNCIINPLTALFNCKNGELLGGSVVGSNTMDQLVHEAGVIIRALPNLQMDEPLRDRFSDERLRGWVNEVARATAENTSSMLQDVRAGRKTEIDYINGYLVQQALETGKPCEQHKALIEEVKQLAHDGSATPSGP